MSEAHELNDDRKYTYADYKAWELKPGERFELIHGDAFAMSAPGLTHQRILMTLSGEFYNFLKNKKCRVLPAPFDVRLFYKEDESDDTVVQPDLVVICDSGKLSEEGCRGAPDMVVEIISPSNTFYEMQRKLNLYKDAMVREYWIIDPKNKNVSVYRLDKDEYILRTFNIQDTVRSFVLSGFEIPLSVIFTNED